MFEAIKYRVKHLLRVRIGNLRLGDLPRGQWRALTQQELKSLHFKNGRPAVAAATGRARHEAVHHTKPGSTPSAAASDETRRL
jgi:hypothetical protein